MVGVGEVRVLLWVGREDPALRPDRRPPVRRHPVLLQPGPLDAATLVVADPTTCEEKKKERNEEKNGARQRETPKRDFRIVWLPDNNSYLIEKSFLLFADGFEGTQDGKER